MPMLQVKRVLADMPYSQVSCVNWKRNWQVSEVTVTPDVILRAPPDVVPKQPVGILVKRDSNAKSRQTSGLCAQCRSESKLVGGIKPRGRYRSRSLSASSTDSYSSESHCDHA